MKKNKLLLILLAFMLFLSAGCAASEPASSSTTNPDDSSKNQESNKEEMGTPGGKLRVAYPAQPQTLDPHMTTALATRDNARLIFETLVTLNENYQIAPMLAESYNMSEDGKTVTFNLRKGVLFHNGKEMKADDVVASMTKWGKTPAAKGNLGEHEWVAKEDYVVELHVKEPSSVLMYGLAETNQFPAIMPKETVEAAGPKGVTDYIGTGPFKFKEWKQNQYIQLVKFDDYVADTRPTNGLAGEKKALVDQIDIHFVTDSATRVTGLLGGQYDFSHMINYDAVPQVESMPGYTVNPWLNGLEVMIFNKKQGLFADPKMRQAVNYGMDKESVARAAFTDEKYYEAGPSLFLPDQKDWFSEAGKELYNPKDVEKAKQLLEEAGYNGEEVVILTSREYDYHYNASVAVQQELEKIGIKAKLDVYDWATLLERRDQPDQYDIFFTAFALKTTPLQFSFFQSDWPGWTDNPQYAKLLNDIKKETNQEQALALLAQLQQTMWEDVPVINVAKDYRVSAYSQNVKGYKDLLGPVFWNVTVK